MKITEHIKKANNKTLFSYEVLPPLKGENIENLFKHMDPLMEFKPPFIDVTYHREEYVFKKRDNGLLEKRSIRKRPGTVGICAAIANRYKVDAVPHIICGGFSKEETENALIDLNFLGIDNVLLLQGDPIKTEASFVPEKEGHKYASDLLKQVVNMNNGLYIDEDIQNPNPTDFCIGISGYPEKHYAAPNLKTDMKYLKMKMELGAEYIVTQMFFDNQKFFEFVKQCREMGINIPIIPGLKPITTRRQMTVLPRFFHIDLPQDLVDAVDKCKDDKAVKKVGIEWCIQQSKELMDFNVPSLHYYSMGRSHPVYEIAKELF